MGFETILFKNQPVKIMTRQKDIGTGGTVFVLSNGLVVKENDSRLTNVVGLRKVQGGLMPQRMELLDIINRKRRGGLI